jgi:hypothetical protein
MFLSWIRRVFRRMSFGNAKLIGDSGWSLLRSDDEHRDQA